MTRKSRRCWSKSIGEPGRRVRLYEARPGGPIMRSVLVNGKEDRKSLKHRDKEKAIGEGYELVRALLANEKALDEQSVTLGMVAELYKQSPAFATKKPRTRKADTRTLERVGSRGPDDGAQLGHEGTDKGRAATLEGKPAPRRPPPTREESETARDAARRLSPA